MPSHPTSKVTVRADVYGAGQLPGVCVVSGLQATEWREKAADSPPNGEFIFAFFGLLPYLVARSVMKKSTPGFLPLAPAAVGNDTAYAAQRVRNIIIGVALLIAGIAAIFISRATATGPARTVFDPATGEITRQDPNLVSVWFGIGAAVLIVAAVIAVALAFRSAALWIKPAFNPQTGLVTLHHVHPNFAEAIARAPHLTRWDPVPAPAGAWHPDPYGRAQSRYFDGHAWTPHVVGPAGQGYDPV